MTGLTAGFVQWFKVARDDGGGFRFVPASWSDTLPAQAIAPAAGAITAAAAEDTAEQRVGAAPAARPL